MSDSIPETFPALVIVGGPRNGEALLLDSTGFDKVIGSGSDCHLRFGEPVDYHHARVAWEEGVGLLLMDESASGTWVNGHKVARERVLRDGDQVSLGDPAATGSIRLQAHIPPQLESPLAHEEGSAGPPAPAPAGPPADRASAAATPAVPAVILDEGAPAAAASEGAARRPVYTDELPSIEPDRPRQRTAPPPAQAARPAKRASVPVAAVAGAGALFLAGAAFVTYRVLDKPAPVVSSVVPPRAEPGQSVTLTGTGFAAEPGDNRVQFGPEPGSVTAASETQLTVVVPAALAGRAGEVAVTVETGGGRSNELRVPLRVVPRATALEPDVAMPGTEVVVKGHNLDLKPLVVTVGGMPATVKAAQSSSLRFEVPRLDGIAEGQAVKVSLQVGTEASRPLMLLLGRLPLVAQVEPPRGAAGDKVVVRGRGFDARPAANTVTFGGERALVLAASDKQLEVVVPAFAMSGNQFRLPVVVQASGGVSAGTVEFTVLRPSAATYLPRFFAAAVPEDATRAFVASELGPLLLLTSPEAGASVAQRAARVAEAVNGLFTGRTPTLEVRGSSVAAAGRPDPVVRATVEDAAGYSQPWNAALQGQRVTPSVLAGYWAALLQDYLALFAQRQRPVRVVELSPRGKVLLDLFAEAERRAGVGGGVPAVLVAPPHPALAAAVRELALSVPARGHGVAGAALLGRWEGTWEEASGAARRIRLQLSMQGGALAGAISTRAGALSMDAPLRSVAYDKGVLTFEAAGSPPRRFRGSLSGSTLGGAVLDPAGKEVGRFSLRYVE